MKQNEFLDFGKELLSSNFAKWQGGQYYSSEVDKSMCHFWKLHVLQYIFLFTRNYSAVPGQHIFMPFLNMKIQ